MTDTPETAAATFVPPAAPILGEALHIESDAVGKLAGLGAKAAGVEIVTLDRGEDYAGVNPGLPRTIPVGIVHGDKPELRGVSDLYEHWRFAPDRRRGTVRADTLGSFIDLTTYLADGDSVVFAETSWTKPAFTTVIDYHGAPDDSGAPGLVAAFGKFRVRYAFPLSEEWTAWVAGNGRPMGQADFAAFLEDRMAELSSPTEAEVIDLERTFGARVATPAELLKLSRGLSVAVGGRVKQAVNLASGEGQIVFEETHSDEDSKPLRVPGLFILQIAPFFMGDPIRLPVRLRYRVADGKVTWFYQLYRPDLHVTDHVRAALDKVRAETELRCFEGAPEMQGV